MCIHLMYARLLANRIEQQEINIVIMGFKPVAARHIILRLSTVAKRRRLKFTGVSRRLVGHII